MTCFMLVLFSCATILQTDRESQCMVDEKYLEGDAYLDCYAANIWTIRFRYFVLYLFS